MGATKEASWSGEIVLEAVVSEALDEALDEALEDEALPGDSVELPGPAPDCARAGGRSKGSARTPRVDGSLDGGQARWGGKSALRASGRERGKR